MTDIPGADPHLPVAVAERPQFVTGEAIRKFAGKPERADQRKVERRCSPAVRLFN
jgi:hypothetical protein